MGEEQQEEINRLRRKVDGLERALKIRDTFLRGDAAAVAYAEICYYLDTMFTGAHGRQMTVSEAIRIISDRTSDYDDLLDEVERLRKAEQAA